ncbi:hypothetical protein [Amnibacterium kyonggiense]
MRRVPALPAAVAALLLVLAVPTEADAATRPTGLDVSFPQCAQPLPPVGDFAVVGVDGGTATTPNPCLAQQLAWAAGSPGTVHAKVDVYVNTANPPRAEASFAPTGDVTRRGRKVLSPYGHCRNGTSRACSWVYGASLAWDDVETSGVTGPVGRWWLDVESVNTWSTVSTADNRAALEGMTAAFQTAGKSVGIYSSASEFAAIVGTVPASSPLHALPSWIPAGTTQAGAERLCTHAPLTAGRLTLTQWRDTAANVDHDVACGSLTQPKPTISGTYRSGHRLTVKLKAWGPGTVHLSYRWTRDGRPIAKATGRTYTVEKADRRHRVGVTVTGTLTGYSAAVQRSATHRIAS